MRGGDNYTENLFSIVRLEEFVPADHPLRLIREWVNAALKNMDTLFSRMYDPAALGGRPSIAPEKLLRAMLLQVLYSIRSERQLVEQISYNLLYRWFVGLSIDDPVWNHSVFSKNRDRMLEHAVITEFFNQVVAMAQERELLSGEHFSVDGTLIKAWAGQKSIRCKDGSDDDRPPGNWHGEKRSNETHASVTDPESRLYRKTKGVGSELAYLGHTMTDNRHCLVVNARAAQATGKAERSTAVLMLRDAREQSGKRITVGADKGYDTQGFVEACRENQITPHLARNINRPGGSAIDGRTTRHPGYAISQQKRKRIEQGFGWAKTIGRMRQVMVRGLDKVDQQFALTMAVYNLVRMRTLMASGP